MTVNARHAIMVAENLATSKKRDINSVDLLAGLLNCEDIIAVALEKAGVDKREFETLAETNGRIADSTEFGDMIETAKLQAIRERESEIDTCHLLMAIVYTKNCMAIRILTIMGVSRDALVETYKSALYLRKQGARLSEIRGNHSRGQKAESIHGSALAAYCVDLTSKARDGQIDPIIGRDKEISRVIDILLRRTKSNPCLIGEAGVGKTAVIEGLAQRVADGNVPAKLRDVIIAELSLPWLVAGTRHRGDFEERVTKLIDVVTARDDIILFIDELHTIVGSGAAEGALDCAGILKPYLARSGLRLIGATTIQEYRQHIETDAALGRRFHEVSVNEVDEAAAITILKELKTRYESYHGVSIEDDVLVAAVKFSARYIPDRRLPDKAIDLIDESSARACARNKHYITENDVAHLVAEMTGIDVARLTQEESERLLNLEEILRQRVVGQDDAVAALAKAIRRGKAGLRSPNRPIGSFLFTGPTGVGKTELCLTLADYLFQHKDALIRLDMSEYMEACSISKLIGAAPGYIGYGDSGTLADRIRTKPYAVVLFDEIEKAHPDILNMLLQIMEDGALTDSHGRTVSFKNAIVVMTSNIGGQCITDAKAPIGFAHATIQPDTSKDAIKELRASFRPEFLNRIDDIIVFNRLLPSDMKAIAKKYLNELTERLIENKITLKVPDAVVAQLAYEGFDDRYGARLLRRVIQSSVEDKIADLIILGELSAGDKIECGITDGIITFDIKPLVGVV